MSSIRLCLVSDTHGSLPVVDKEVDIFIHAGDLSPHRYGKDISRRAEECRFQLDWCREKFLPWIENIPAKHKFFIAGNHDFFADPASNPTIQPYEYHSAVGSSHYLYTESRVVKVRDRLVSVWGSPYSPWFCDWAFNGPRDLNDAHGVFTRLYAAIPEYTDIIISHGPPRGFGDRTESGERVGCVELTQAINRLNCKLVVTGHIHEARGSYQLTPSCTVVNAAVCDMRNRLAYEPVYWTLE